jgi:tRNA G18 (ribose-2'-O)-methylase SpoU
VIHRVARADDARLEPYRHVGAPDWLFGRQLFVAEGRLVVRRLLAAGTYDIHSILVTSAAMQALEHELERFNGDVYVCESAVVERVTGFNFHRGCLALARRGEPRSAESLIGGRRLVALEAVGNPDNVGGIFRAAAALGADGVLLDPLSADPLYRKAIRTSMGSVLALPWARADCWPGVLDAFREAGWRLVALTPSESAVAIADYANTVESGSRLLLLAGAEGEGLSPAALEAADVRVHVPIETVDSLNVVVATGIALDRLR